MRSWCMIHALTSGMIRHHPGGRGQCGHYWTCTATSWWATRSSQRLSAAWAASSTTARSQSAPARPRAPPGAQNLRTLGIYVTPSTGAIVLRSPRQDQPRGADTKGHADQHDRGRHARTLIPPRRCPRHSRSTTRSPHCGVHDSMTSTVAPGFSRVVTTSEMPATNRSPPGPSPTGPAGTARPATFASPGHPASLPSFG